MVTALELFFMGKTAMQKKQIKREVKKRWNIDVYSSLIFYIHVKLP